MAASDNSRPQSPRGSFKWLVLALCAGLCALVLWPAGAAAADSPRDILVIVNRASSSSAVSAADVRDFFLKKRRNWPLGSSVVPINAPEGTTLRDEFRKHVLGMTKREEDDHWRNSEIMHGLPRPAEFRAALKAVFKIKDSVSYVFRADYISGVATVLLVLPATEDGKTASPTAAGEVAP